MNKNKYDSLSAKEKSELFKTMINYGIKDLNLIKNFYNNEKRDSVQFSNHLKAIGDTENYKNIISKGNTFKDGGRLNNPPSYIGGNTEDARNLYLKTDARLIAAVQELSGRYNIPTELVIQSLAKEGIIDRAIQNYNQNKGNVTSLVDNEQEISFYNNLGLDHIGGRYNNQVKTNRKIPFKIESFINEKGAKVPSGRGSFLDGLELKVAELKYTYDKAKENYPKASSEDLTTITRAMYNRGISGAKRDLKNNYKATIDYYKTPIKRKQLIDSLNSLPSSKALYNASIPNGEVKIPYNSTPVRRNFLEEELEHILKNDIINNNEKDSIKEYLNQVSTEPLFLDTKKENNDIIYSIPSEPNYDSYFNIDSWKYDIPKRGTKLRKMNNGNK